jgi:hypothetical protein
MFKITLLALFGVFHANKIRFIVEPVLDDPGDEPAKMFRIFDGGDNLIYFNAKRQEIVGYKVTSHVWLNMIEKAIDNAYTTRSNNSVVA